MQNSSIKPKSDLLRLSLTLFVISGVMALLVAFVNNVTEPVIAQRNAEKITNALSAVIADADEFKEITTDTKSVTSSDGKQIPIDGVWGAYKDGAFLGTCVKVSPQGYGGAVEMIVAVGADHKIIDTQIVSLSETSGIGTKIQDDSFLSQFVGISSTSEVSVISGATKSSNAFLRGVNAAMSVANKVAGGNN